MTPGQIDAFLKQYAAGNYSEADHAAFRAWLDSATPMEQSELAERFRQISENEVNRPSANLQLMKKIENALDESDREKQAGRQRGPRNSVVMLKRLAAAAVLLFFITTGYLLYQRSISKQLTPTAALHSDVAPGKNGAILVLADGSAVVLDSLQNGVVAKQNGVKVILQGGGIGYAANSGNTAAPGKVEYNVLHTPKGRQFRVVLPDGTNVWLNAASSIRYPTQFTGADREVEISGEVYFDVAKDVHHPFRVKLPQHNGAAAGTVEALGTEFNVNAYTDEAAFHVTLLEGSVLVAPTSGEQKEILKPSQQATIPISQPITVTTVNTDQVIAWKKGLFDFEDVPLTALVKQLSRWYDIDVQIEKGVPDIEFGGKMSRNLMLSDIVKALNDSGVHCRLENGKKLVIFP